MGLHIHLPTAESKEHKGIRSSLKPHLKLAELRKVDLCAFFFLKGEFSGCLEASVRELEAKAMKERL